MATITPSVSENKVLPKTFTTSWTLSAAPSSDTFSAVEMRGNADRSVHIVGAAGATGFNGCTVQVQGSNDNENFVVLTDGLGNNLQFTAAGIKQICEAVRYIKIAVTSGTAGTTLVGYIHERA